MLDKLNYIPQNSDVPVSSIPYWLTVKLTRLQDLDDNGFNQYNVTGVFANGSAIKSGEYKVLLRALRVTGNPAALSDYEFWLSPEFIVKAE